MAQNAYWNKKTGTGWKKGTDGKWYQYKNFKKTGNSKKNLTLGSGIAKSISSTVKKAQSSMKIRADNRVQEAIGKGTSSNPQFIRHQRSGKLMKNPNYKPTTKTTTEVKKTTSTNKNNNTNKSSNKGTFQNKVSGNGGSKVTKTTTSAPKKEAWKTDAAKKWLDKTRRSPAAKSRTHGKPTFSDKERWELQQKHRAWKAKRGR